MGSVRRLQLSLAILKPDLVANPIARQDVLSTILKHNFYIVRSNKLQLSRNRAQDFYSEHRHKFFFNRLVSYMCSGPIYVYILARHDARTYWRTLLGPTKVFKTIYSAPNSIRGRYGLTDTRNSTHGSDSEESAHKEIEFFFPEFNIHQWRDVEEEHFRKGNVDFESDKEMHIIKKKL